jgi:hypothetical protein
MTPKEPALSEAEGGIKEDFEGFVSISFLSRDEAKKTFVSVRLRQTIHAQINPCHDELFSEI